MVFTIFIVLKVYKLVNDIYYINLNRVFILGLQL